MLARSRTEELIEIMKSDLDQATKEAHIAVLIAQIDDLNKFLEAKISFNVPFLVTLQKGYVEMSKMFLDAGADLSLREKVSASYLDPRNRETADLVYATPLMIAAANGRKEVARMLLEEKKVDVNEKKEGKTALFYASRNLRRGVIAQLILAGANLDLAYNDLAVASSPPGAKLNPKDYLSQEELREYLSRKESKATPGQPSQLGAFGSRSTSPTRSATASPDQLASQGAVAVVVPESNSPSLR